MTGRAAVFLLSIVLVGSAVFGGCLRQRLRQFGRGQGDAGFRNIRPCSSRHRESTDAAGHDARRHRSKGFHPFGR